MPIHRPKHNAYTSRTGRHMGWTFYQHVPGGTGATTCHVTPTQYPNFFSLSLWREYSQVLVIKHSWSTTSRPFSWAKAITGAWVDGSSKKARNTSGLLLVVTWIRGRSRGCTWRKAVQWAAAAAVVAARPGHYPVARCRRVPGRSPVQPGTRHVPVPSSSQCLLIQQVL